MQFYVIGLFVYIIYAGRAGRVSDGRVYRLVNRSFYNELPRFGSPEMQVSVCGVGAYGM